MKEQFFGKAFWWSFGGLALTFLLAFFTRGTALETPLLALIALGVLLVSIQRLEYGLFIAFAELIGTSHGHLLNAHGISLRMAIFGAVMIAWLTHLARGKRINLGDKRLRPYYLLLLAVAIGFVAGLKGKGIDVTGAVIDDGNGYLFILYILPMLTVAWNNITRRTLLQVFAGSATFVSFLTLVILYLFTHMTEPVQRILYAFFRDARVAELTRVAGDIFRVFLQAQFFDVALLLILASASFWFWKIKRDQNTLAYWMIFTLSTMIISLSRSFWIGLIAGGIALALAILMIRKPSVKEVVIKKLSGVLMLVTSVALIWIVLAFPFPRGANVSGFGNLLSDRTSQSDVAISSRWKLLPAMMEQIKESPIVGKGFGAIVAFESDDPRVRAIYPDGLWRTYSFEWGWLDLWLKMGLLGPVAFLWLGLQSAKGLIRGFKTDQAWLSIGLFSGLIALYATHTFSPYLNHPIGLGFLVFLTPFLVNEKTTARQGAMVAIKDIIAKTADRTRVQIPEGSSAVSLQAGQGISSRPLTPLGHGGPTEEA